MIDIQDAMLLRILTGADDKGDDSPLVRDGMMAGGLVTPEKAKALRYRHQPT